MKNLRFFRINSVIVRHARDAGTRLFAYRLSRSVASGILILTVACGGANGQMSSDDGWGDVKSNTHDHEYRKQKKHHKPTGDIADEPDLEVVEEKPDFVMPDFPGLANMSAFIGLDPEIITMFMSGKFDLTKLKPEQLAQIQGLIDKYGDLNTIMAKFAGLGNFPFGSGIPGSATATLTLVSTSTATSQQTSTAIQTVTSTESATETMTAVATSTETSTGIGGFGECPVDTYCIN